MKKHNFLILLLTTILTLSITITVFAAQTTHQISAVDVILTVPDGLYSLTRNVSEGNKAVDILDASPEELYASYQQKGIYLDIFPEDLSYEIILIAGTSTDSTPAVMNDEELRAYEDSLKQEYDSLENETFLSVSQHTSNGINYIVTSSHYKDDYVSSYAMKYYTVQNGFAYNYILQTNDIEITDEQINVMHSLLDSAQYTEVDSSITESPFYTTIKETLIGGGLSIAILALILYLLTRSTRKTH